MKKIVLTSLLALAFIGSAEAHGPNRYGSYHGYYHGCYGCGGGWVAPALIGGVIGYELARPPVVVEQPIYANPPVYIEPTTNYVQQPPVGYHWQQMIDPQTNTAKIVLVPN